jgi:hypothetical protein
MLANRNTKNPFRRVAQQFAYNSRRVDKGTEQYKAQFEDWGSQRDITSRKGQSIEAKTALAKLSTEESHHSMSQAMEEARAGSDAGLRRLRLEDSITVTERVRARMNGTTVEEMRTSNYTINRDENGKITNPNKYTKYAEAITKRAVHLDQGSRIIASATSSAQAIQQQKFAQVIDKNIDLQQLAGGIDPNGAQRALANAFAVMSKARAETIDNAGKIIDFRNLSNAQVRLLSQGTVDVGVDIKLTQDIRAAALKRVLGGTDTEQLELAMQNIDFSFAGTTAQEREELQIIAGEALQSNSARPPEVGAGVTGRMKLGLDFRGNSFTGPLGLGGVRQMIVDAANAEKLDAGKLQTAGKDYSKAILDMLGDPTFSSQLTAVAKKRLKSELKTVLDPTREASERLGDSKSNLENIEKLL